jgi:hypothetical protein
MRATLLGDAASSLEWLGPNYSPAQQGEVGPVRAGSYLFKRGSGKQSLLNLVARVVEVRYIVL